MLGKDPPNHLELIHQGAARREKTQGLAEVLREEEVGRGMKALAPEPQHGFTWQQLRVCFFCRWCRMGMGSPRRISGQPAVSADSSMCIETLPRAGPAALLSPLKPGVPRSHKATAAPASWGNTCTPSVLPSYEILISLMPSAELHLASSEGSSNAHPP